MVIAVLGCFSLRVSCAGLVFGGWRCGCGFVLRYVCGYGVSA